MTTATIGMTVKTAINVMPMKPMRWTRCRLRAMMCFMGYDNILSARFLARKTTDDAAMFTPSEIRNRTMPMKNNT